MIPAALLAALIAVESSGNDHAVGDSGQAIGCLQIHEKVIEDVNRIYGTTYQLAHRLDRQMSLRICELYLKHWGSKLPRIPTLEDYARIWNGGPQGWKNAATKRYWAKVNAVLAASSAPVDKRLRARSFS